MQWLVDMWNTYKEVIIPILMTVASVGGSFLLAYIPRFLARLATKIGMDNDTISQIKGVVEHAVSREEFAPLITTVKSLTQKAAAAEEQNKLLAEMLKVAFDGTSLDPQYKEQLNSIYSKVLYKTEDALVDALEEKLKLANDKILALEQAATKEEVIPETPATTTPRVRT